MHSIGVTCVPLLETVSTVFQGLPVGDGTIQGKYFNKIAMIATTRYRFRGEIVSTQTRVGYG